MEGSKKTLLMPSHNGKTSKIFVGLTGTGSQKLTCLHTLNLGVIAQEAEEICPGVVSYGEVEDQVWSEKIKDEFKPLAKEGKKYDEYKAVAYSIIAMKSAKALQEAILRIEELEAKVAALEGN